ncbi:MAG: hypothetical protein MUO62_09340 [Anaerolineales bacterium]|jgi:RNase adaptor protein for sRNA GlmZ degradation|nr:hypothetical protein [Anaerolineales bacterium]
MHKIRVIGVVGACGTGKSELVNRLKNLGYQAIHIAQEHSFAPKMWMQLTNPDFLVFLEVSYPETMKRKKFNWTEKEFSQQLFRLRHAKANADLVIDTDHISPDEVFEVVLSELNSL